MTSADVTGLAPALVRLALRSEQAPMEFDYAMRVIDDMTPDEKTDLVRTQAQLVAALIRCASTDLQLELVAMYERGLIS